MEEVSAQTAAPKEELANLTCSDLLEKLYLPLPEGYIILKDKNAVIFIHCSSRSYGNFLLRQNQYCYEAIKDFLGIQPITQCLMEAKLFNEELSTSELRSIYIGEVGAAGCLMFNSAWVGEKEQCGENSEESKENLEGTDSCAPHEPTHVFVSGTLLHRNPPWLNEGLAEYVSIQLLSQYHILECFADSFRYGVHNDVLNYTKEGKYVPLDIEREEHRQQGTEHDAYLTGACLWDHIDATYGHETFKAIMQDVNASRFACTSFIDDILQHHIGESGIDDLKNKFGDDSVEVFE